MTDFAQLWWYLIFPFLLLILAADILHHLAKRQHRLAVEAETVPVYANESAADRAECEDIHHQRLVDGGWYDPEHSRFKPVDPWAGEVEAAPTLLDLRETDDSADCDRLRAIMREVRLGLLNEPAADGEIIDGELVADDTESWSDQNGWGYRQSWPLILAAARGNVDEDLVLRGRSDDTVPPFFAETLSHHAMPENPTIAGFTESWNRADLLKMLEAS